MISTGSSSVSPRVAVNLMWCRPGRVGGSEEYLCRQLQGLPEGRFALSLFAPRGFALAHPELAESFSIHEMNHDARSRVRRIMDESTWLYRRTSESSIVHHGGGTVPLRSRRPIVLTIHDVQYLEFPRYFGQRRLGYLRRMVPRAVKCASLVLVPTHFVKRTIIDAFGAEPDDVVVVPHGVETSLGERATDEDVLRAKYSLGEGPIVVYPAVTHPHKSHAFLIDVHRRHWARRGVTLVLIGGEGTVETRIRSLLADPGTSDSVRRLGRVPTQDRDGLIRMADALVFPSEYEGFGAPVIEAMALGTPVIVSDRACLPEVVGSAGLVVPLDSELWGAALDVLERRRVEFVAAGYERRSSFTTEVSGAALADAYHRVLH